jgi:hypothetical protein
MFSKSCGADLCIVSQWEFFYFDGVAVVFGVSGVA